MYYLTKPEKHGVDIMCFNLVLSDKEIIVGEFQYQEDFKIGTITFSFHDKFPIVYESMDAVETMELSKILNDISFIIGLVERSKDPLKSIDILTNMYGEENN